MIRREDMNCPYWSDILEANAYCRKRGWVSYQIIRIEGKGYTVKEIKTAEDEKNDRQ